MAACSYHTQRIRAAAQGALLAGFACLVGAQREPLPAAGAPCTGCQCGDNDLTPYRTHDGGVFQTPADKDGYTYMFSMCDDISPPALPAGCQGAEHPAVLRFREEDPSSCVVLGSFGPCELGSECGMSYAPVAASEAHGAGFYISWRYQNDCHNIFWLFLSEGHETEPAQAPFNDPSHPCSWTMVWQSLDAYSSSTDSSETKIEAEPPTGVDATIALLFCYACWLIFAGMMIVYACGIPEQNNHTTGVDEIRPASQRCPAVERALGFHQLPHWQRRLVTFQWATCGNVLFIVASLVYVVASVLNFQLTYYDVAWVGDYYFYDKINLCGALIFTIEPLIDVVGVIACTWFTTIDQAHWETFGRKQPFRPDSKPTSDSTASISEHSVQHTASNPLSASNSEDSSGGRLSVVEGMGDNQRYSGSPDGEYSLNDDPWLLVRAPTPQPWWQRWQWQGYVVWEKVPTTRQLVLQDLNLYAALFFFLASLGYLWAAALPWMYDDFCMDTEGTYCAIVANPKYLSQWQGPNATYTMHLEVPCDTDNAGRLVNRSGYLIGGTVSKYVEMGDVGARGFVFDALVGLAAWWGSFKHRQSLSSAPLSLCPLWSDWRRRWQSQQGDRPTTRLSGSSVDYHVASGVTQTDWLGVGCCIFLFTSWLDVVYGFGWENFGGPWLYFTSMVCWTLCGFCYITDSLGGTSLADVTLAPRIKKRSPHSGEDCGEVEARDQSLEEVEWVDMYEEADLFGSATCAIGVAGLICCLAISWVFSSTSMPHEIVTAENGGYGAD